MSTQSIDSTDNVYSIQENSEKTLINTEDNKAPLNDSFKDEKMNDSSDVTKNNSCLKLNNIQKYNNNYNKKQAEIPEIEQLAIKTTTEIQSSRNRKIKYGPYEKVVTTVIFSSKLIALNCLGNKKFVSLNKSKQLCANKFKIDGPAESFEMQYLSGGFIALLSKEKNKYCTAENEGKETLVANRPVIFGTW